MVYTILLLTIFHSEILALAWVIFLDNKERKTEEKWSSLKTIISCKKHCYIEQHHVIVIKNLRILLYSAIIRVSFNNERKKKFFHSEVLLKLILIKRTFSYLSLTKMISDISTLNHRSRWTQLPRIKCKG